MIKDTNNTYKVAVIGAGQAGLATSYFLQKAGIKHIVLEENIIGHSWISQRWDSFKMNTPNWMTELPGMPLSQTIRENFMDKDEFVEYLTNYSQQFELPILEKYKVVNIKKQGSLFVIITENNGKTQEIHADTVVIASGIMNKIKFPTIAEKIPDNIVQLHASQYKNPNQLLKGNILIVGGGQSGCQIAEELALAGRKVYLASSKVSRAPRRYKGRDIMEWLNLMGIQDISTQQLRENPNLNATQPQSSGVGILGHTVSYQSLNKLGATIFGTFKNIVDGIFYFADNAKENIRFADDTSRTIKQNIDTYLKKHPELETGIEEEDFADLSDIDCISASKHNKINALESGFTSIIWATGFGYDFSYLESSLLDDKGIPKHYDGKTSLENLYCIGFPGLRKKKSGLVFGVKEDAEVIVKRIISKIENTF
ncbi:NAD(P)-binding domain-containing protein [Myroides odoratus]|uniref:NAD(P)-binding domain-containing protein n=1 Tax=Myroides odoratus TaxID=256 RepID=UPI0039AF9263